MKNGYKTISVKDKHIYDKIESSQKCVMISDVAFAGEEYKPMYFDVEVVGTNYVLTNSILKLTIDSDNDVTIAKNSGGSDFEYFGDMDVDTLEWSQQNCKPIDAHGGVLIKVYDDIGLKGILSGQLESVNMFSKIGENYTYVNSIVDASGINAVINNKLYSNFALLSDVFNNIFDDYNKVEIYFKPLEYPNTRSEN